MILISVHFSKFSGFNAYHMIRVNFHLLLFLCIFIHPSYNKDWDMMRRENSPRAGAEPDHPVSSNEQHKSCFGDFDFDCGIGELRSRCISAFWHCDNVFDCTTGTDELGCHYLHRCPVGDFSCRNGDCILAQLRCNGIPDCIDGSDERGCGLPEMPCHKKNPKSPPVASSPKPLNPSVPNIDHKLVEILSKRGHQDEHEKILHNNNSWFAVLSVLLAMLIVGQLLVLAIVCVKRNRRQVQQERTGKRENNRHHRGPKLYSIGHEKLGQISGKRTTRVRFVSASSTSIIPISECPIIFEEEEEAEQQQQEEQSGTMDEEHQQQEPVLKKL